MTLLPNPGSEPILPGKPVELTCQFQNDNEGAEEPISVQLYIRWPGQKLGEGELVTPTKKEPGLWAYNFIAPANRAGRSYFYWYGDGVSAEDGTFVIGGKRV